MQRENGRDPGALRPVKMLAHYNMHAEGSVLIEMGNTRVLCTATVEESVPAFLKGTGEGWVTAEYAMLPRATQTRNRRESTRGQRDGRSTEIQRLIGRSLRAVVDRKALGERQIIIDCDVLQADGGTRCAAITGGFAALYLACADLVERGVIASLPLSAQVVAVSLGLDGEKVLLDMDYGEDSRSDVDCNLVMTSGGELIEIQGTGEKRPFTDVELRKILTVGKRGCARLCKIQQKITGAIGQQAQEEGV